MHRLISYFLTAKNYCNRIVYVKIIASQRWDIFLRHSVDMHTHNTGWHRINRTIKPFNQVYEYLHKITPLTLVAHRQIRRHERNMHLNILWQIVLYVTSSLT